MYVRINVCPEMPKITPSNEMKEIMTTAAHKRTHAEHHAGDTKSVHVKLAHSY